MPAGNVKAASLHELPELAADAHAGRPAVRDNTGRWTYAELLARSTVLAGCLQRLRVGPGERVLVRADAEALGDLGVPQATLDPAGGPPPQPMFPPPAPSPDGPAVLLYTSGSTSPTPTAVLLQLSRRDEQPVPIRIFTNTGEEFTLNAVAQLRRSFPGARVHLMFGVTECKRISIMEADGDLGHPGSVGRPALGRHRGSDRGRRRAAGARWRRGRDRRPRAAHSGRLLAVTGGSSCRGDSGPCADDWRRPRSPGCACCQAASPHCQRKDRPGGPER